MPSTLVHVAIGGLVGAALLGDRFSTRAIIVVLVAAALPDLDSFLTFVPGGHRSALHSLFVPGLLAVGIYWDGYVAERSWLANRFGRDGGYVAAVALASFVAGGYRGAGVAVPPERQPQQPAVTTGCMEIRPYEPQDADGLWQRKRDFELGLGTGTGSQEKETKYEGKLDDQYRKQWLAWVERCVAEDERCVTVAVDPATADDPAAGPGTAVVGYVFVLPESLRFIWDAAVLNEVYVSPAQRGTGVADDLMDAATAFARDQDLPLDRLVLDVDAGNDRAKAFYERHGFEHWGEMVAREL